MNQAPNLRDFQLWLKWVITDPRGVTEALNDPAPIIEQYQSRYTSPTPSYLEFVFSSSSSEKIDRFDIYAEGYFSRILDYMRETFFKTRKAVGDETFTLLVAEYLKAFPSKYTSIDEVGCDFTNFITEFDAIKLDEWIFDLARFEWSWIESFYAEDVKVQNGWQDELAKNPNSSLLVHSSVRLVRSDWPLHQLIQLLDSDEGKVLGDFSEKSNCAMIIYRANDEIHYEEISLSCFQILEKLKNGNSLNESLNQIQNIDHMDISNNFSFWVSQGILCGLLNERKAST